MHAKTSAWRISGETRFKGTTPRAFGCDALRAEREEEVNEEAEVYSVQGTRKRFLAGC